LFSDNSYASVVIIYAVVMSVVVPFCADLQETS
jgi:hypothetical protein